MYMYLVSSLFCQPAGDTVTEYPVIPVKPDDIVDTNGAGDAFVGGRWRFAVLFVYFGLNRLWKTCCSNLYLFHRTATNCIGLCSFRFCFLNLNAFLPFWRKMCYFVFVIVLSLFVSSSDFDAETCHWN